jgi:hypothetical protein
LQFTPYAAIVVGLNSFSRMMVITRNPEDE